MTTEESGLTSLINYAKSEPFNPYGEEEFTFKDFIDSLYRE
jgi:hypothetical protein